MALVVRIFLFKVKINLMSAHKKTKTYKSNQDDYF